MFSRVHQFFSSHLERKLALLLSLVALVSLVVLGLLAIPTITTTRQNDVEELQRQLVNQYAVTLGKYIDDRMEMLNINVVGDAAAAEAYAQLHGIVLQSLLTRDSSLVDVSFVSAADASEEERWGRVDGVVQKLEPRPPLDANDPIYAEPRLGKNYLSPIAYVSDKPHLVVSTPITTKEGAFLSVLRAEIDLSNLSVLVSQANLGTSGYLYIIDNDHGRVLAQSSNLGVNRTTRKLLAPNFVRELLVRTISLYPYPTSSYISTLSNKAVLMVGRELPALGLSVVSEWPTDEAMAPVTAVVNRLLLALVGLLLLLIVISIFLARGLTKPLRALRDAADSIGHGKFDVKIKVTSHDEVGQLASSFTNMSIGLKELERLKDEFVFIAAHELRTPVTAIRGYAEMLGDLKGVPAQGSEFVQRLQQSGARLANLVNDLLEVARSQAGRLKVQTTPQDIVVLVQATLAELKPLADEKKHTVLFAPPASLPQVMADKDKLQEVLVNLVGNAVKYTPPGGRIEVSLRPEPGAVVAAIKDSGIGIAPADQAKLFERFFRVESDATKSIQGTGLGLFIVRQLIERMNGKVWVESEVGKGSTFSFELPAVRS